MVKIECDKGHTVADIKDGNFFEICCIISTLIDILKKRGIKDDLIKMGVQSAMETTEGENE